ncbi:MAG: hypothetical protein LCH36_10255 [Actinobacteria bacterium]|nr:hypothetical protein [Actinomycetota bacterium]
MHITKRRLLPGDDLESPALTSMPDTVRLLAWSLRLLTDSTGREILDPRQIRDAIWPTKPKHRPRPTPAEVEDMMMQLDETGWLQIYSHPTDPSTTLFQITATWPPDPSRDQTSNLPSPPKFPHQDADLTGVVTTAVEGEGERERAREWEREAAWSHPAPQPEPESFPVEISAPAAPPQSLGIKLSPSRFCSLHRGGPPEGVDCRDCGTARGRAERHLELKTARRRAQALPPIEREFMIRGIDAELRELEEAAAAAGRPRSAPQTLPGMEYTATSPEPAPDRFADWDPSEF